MNVYYLFVFFCTLGANILIINIVFSQVLKYRERNSDLIGFNRHGSNVKQIYAHDIDLIVYYC